MSVSFSRVPANLRVPLFYMEFDNSMANSASTTQRTLLIGQMSGDTTAKNGQPERINAVTQAASLFGQGSVLHLMTKAYFENDNAAELWILPFADTATQTAASGSLTITNGPTDTGVISLHIAGMRLQLVVMATESPATLTGRLATAINENRILPVTAQAQADKVILTAKNKGTLGNEIDVRLNYLGQAGGEVLPAGLTLNITPLTGGAGVPDLMAGLANLKDKGVDFIVNPYTDTQSLNTLQTFLSDTGGRWAWDQQLYGHSFSAVKGTYGQLAEFGEKRNDQHASLIGITASPSPTYQWSAAYVGAIAGSLRNDPGRPLQTLVINGVLPPSDDKHLTLIERNNLLHSGISTFTVADDNRVQVENIITSYQKNRYGDADESYLQVETVFLLMFVSRFMRSQITSKFARMKLADNGTRFAPGSAIVTPNLIRAELIAQYRRLATNGYVQDAEAFVKGLQVEKNRQDPNRVDVLWTGTLINQLRIFAVLNQFRLQTG